MAPPPTLRADRLLLAVKLAKACAELGARVRTINVLTGLPPREVLRLLFPDRQQVPRGRPPDSPDWYHTANLLHRVEASLIVAVYRRLHAGGFADAEALVGAYRHYRALQGAHHRISFDRAFDLVSHTDGIWLATSPSFVVAICPACSSEYLTAYGVAPRSNDECPFCKLVQRYASDPRLQASFPVRPLPDLSTLEDGIRQRLLRP